MLFMVFCSLHALGPARRLFDSASERVMWRLRQRLFSAIVHQDIAFFDVTRTGELMNRLSEVGKQVLEKSNGNGAM